MSDRKLIWLALVLAVIALGVILVRPAKTVIQNITGQPQLGALTGPDIPSQYLNVGGVRHEYRSISTVTKSTTTPCMIQAPTSTSTLIFTSFNVTSATGTARVFYLSKGATYNATTTELKSESVAANETAVLTGGAASTTQGKVSGSIGNVISPSHWVVWSIKGGTTPDDGITGNCNAEFIVN